MILHPVGIHLQEPREDQCSRGRRQEGSARRGHCRVQVRLVEPEIRPGVRRGDQREGGANRRPHQQRWGHDVPVLQGAILI